MGKSKQKTTTQQQTTQATNQTATVAPNAQYTPYIDDALDFLKPSYEAAATNNTSLMPRVNSVLDYYGGNLANDNLTSNPYLQGIIDKTGRGVTDRVNAQFSSAGRYGSGQHAGILAEKLAEGENQLRYSDYAAQQSRADQLKQQAAQGTIQASGFSAALPQLASGVYADAVRQLVGGYTTGTQQGNTSGTLNGTSTTVSKPSILQMLIAAGNNAAAAYAGGG